MAEKIRIAGKLLLIIVCTVCLIYLIHKDEKVFQLKQPEGEGVAVADVLILMDALMQGNGEFSKLTEQNAPDDYLTYESYLKLLESMNLADEEELLYSNRYREQFYLLKEDWYKAYDVMISIFGMEEDVVCKEIAVLSGDDCLLEEKVGDNCVLTATGDIFSYRSQELSGCRFQTIMAYVAEDTILTLKEKTKNTFCLENIWVMEKEAGQLQIFTMGFEILCPWNETKGEIYRETIADITIGEGEVQKGISKQERISGRLLRISDAELEIEGKGTFFVHPSCKVYRLYEELQEQEVDALQLGYDFADYVIADDKVCGVLILRKENMESIRVAIRSNGFASLYHENITIKADCDMEITYGPYEERQREMLKAGEQVSFYENSDYLSGDMVMLKPLVLSGKMQVLSLERNQGIPSYRGSLQIAKTKEGLTLVNEVLLEEYLYSVVPSEMPASYPQEALKAQAVCARTYAYRYLETPGLGNIGANVDDSVGYQVYNNIAENVNSTKAVKETAGCLLIYDEEPVNTYYYSTSCGFGTDAGVWQESNVSEYPYLSSVHINRQQKNGEDNEQRTDEGHTMQLEEKIREYLLSGNEEDYEYKEAWYRWKYVIDELDVSIVYERLYSRFHADNTKILKLTEGEAGKENERYESVKPTEFHEIYHIECVKRRNGGVMDELILYTDNGTYKVISEYNIRYILNNGGKVIRQDDSMADCGQLLPSAYIVIEEKIENDVVTGYEIIGGGYGHGVGMSQNGAKGMAKEGMRSEEIITFFYPECELKQIY